MDFRFTHIVPKDGRNRRSKGKTERHNIQMDDKVITVFRLTKKSHRPTTKTWYARCFLGGKARQVTSKTDDLVRC